MKKFLLLGLFMAYSFLNVNGQNLLTNPSFETWTGTGSLDTPTDWYGSKSNVAKSDVTEYLTSSHEGSKSCQLEHTSSSSHRRFTTAAVVLTNDEHTLSYWVRGQGDIRNGFYDGSYATYSSYNSINSTGWTQIIYTFTPSAGNVEVIFSIRSTNSAKDHLQIDDVMLVKGPLPITLSFFNGVQKNNQVSLTWETATEINNEYFTIERSTDGLRFEVIGKVAGAGNSTTTKKYEFFDNTPMRGTNYYRLTQTDYDGQSETFDVVAVDYKGKVNVSVTPTQITNTLTLSLEPMERAGRVTIFNLVGKRVFDSAIEAGSNLMEIDASSFARGQYFAKVANGNLVETVRFIKQ